MKVAVLSDIHFPFHDPVAWALTLRLLKATEPDEIVWLGDICDHYAVSSFSRDPKRMVRFQEEFDITHKHMRQVRDALKTARMRFLRGNHEERLEAYKNNHPEISSLTNLELPQLLGFKELNCELVPAGSHLKIGKLNYFHGHEASGGSIYPARAVYYKQQGSQIIGHYHKAQVFYNRLLDGTVHGSWANPCLCLLKQAYIKGISQWQQGWSLVHYVGNSGLFHAEQLVYFTLQHNKNKHSLGCVWNGELFKA